MAYPSQVGWEQQGEHLQLLGAFLHLRVGLRDWV